ncbi:thioesterase family protein [Nocardioides sp.]|uniref:acyl-CoA thioesterase n=1 Tax=Nocardioides sp. TaxID=35761 RepID=UPI0027242AF6|nr:thioesterase family protein [Nocardioides sp.]MDO9457126.1 thioesterase family protein [Nocardioides sp.]
MRHVYRCPVRWADLDLLGHVNNVVYVDYLQEARVDFMRALLPPRAADMTEGVVVVRHEVGYRAPMGFRFRPVEVECWVTEVRAATFTLGYEVFHEDEGERTVYVRATTVLTPYVFADERPRRLTADEKTALGRYLEPEDTPRSRTRTARLEREDAFRWPLHVRFSDVDAYRHVNNVKYFEYLQESRIRLMADVTRGHDGVGRPSIVVAQTDVDYLAPILQREEPYDVWSQIARVGTRSMTIESEIADGDRPLALGRVTVVFFDMETQRSAEPPADLHALLLTRVNAPS